MDSAWMQFLAQILLIGQTGRADVPGVMAGVLLLMAAGWVSYLALERIKLRLWWLIAGILLFGSSMVIFIPLLAEGLTKGGLFWPLSMGELRGGDYFWLSAYTALAVMIWVRGYTLSGKPLTYNKIGVLFETGVVIFALLFLIKAIFSLAFPTNAYIFVFFFLGLWNIALARINRIQINENMAAFKNFCLIFLGGSFTLLAVSAVFFSLALFPVAAYVTRESAGGLAVLLEPLAGVILRALKLLAQFLGYVRPDSTSQPPPPEESQGFSSLPGLPAASGWVLSLYQWLIWVAGGVVVLGLLWLFLMWLMSAKTSAPGKHLSLRQVLLVWWQSFRSLAGYILNFISFVMLRLMKQSPHQPLIARVYREVQQLGRIYGLPRATWETPAQYMKRWQEKYPEVAPNLAVITDGFVRWCYAGVTLAPGEEEEVRKHWREVRLRLRRQQRDKVIAVLTRQKG